MKIIKLSAIASTNSFLKELAQNSILENYTVVVTQNQTNGRGQQASKWFSEPYKNLTFSVFIKFKELLSKHNRFLNFAISLAVFEILQEKNTPKLTIKWPNDILSVNKKICGILIENSVKGSFINTAIVGIGLNVNQEYFPKEIPNAISLKNIHKRAFNLETLLERLIRKIEEKIRLLELKEFDFLELNYLNLLYKKNIPTLFSNHLGIQFMGIIKGISTNGKLQIQLEDDSIKEFGIKEIAFL